MARVERPDRGGVWMDYLAERRAAEQRWARRLGLDREDEPRRAPSVRLLHVDGDEDRLLAALLFEAAGVPEERTLAEVGALGGRERAQMLGDLVGARANRRHRPGRGFEALRYRFEIVSDYGAFRDLQRHRLLTVQWQPLTPDLGAEVPEEVAEAGLRSPLPRGAGARAGRVRPARRAGHAARRPTRCASATASATCSTSMPARRCT